VLIFRVAVSLGGKRRMLARRYRRPCQVKRASPQENTPQHHFFFSILRRKKKPFKINEKLEQNLPTPLFEPKNKISAT
jgi:hypothetical protein